MRPGGLGSDPVRVVTRGDEQHRGGFGTDTGEFEQRRCDFGDQVPQAGPDLFRLGVEAFDASRQVPDGAQRDIRHRIQ